MGEREKNKERHLLLALCRRQHVSPAALGRLPKSIVLAALELVQRIPEPRAHLDKSARREHKV